MYTWVGNVGGETGRRLGSGTVVVFSAVLLVLLRETVAAGGEASMVFGSGRRKMWS